MLPQVLTQVKPVSDLGRMRQGPLDGISIAIGPITADDINVLMPNQPGKNGIRGAIRQQIEWLACFEVDQDGAVAISSPERKVIDP